MNLDDPESIERGLSDFHVYLEDRMKRKDELHAKFKDNPPHRALNKTERSELAAARIPTD